MESAASPSRARNTRETVAQPVRDDRSLRSWIAESGRRAAREHDGVARRRSGGGEATRPAGAHPRAGQQGCRPASTGRRLPFTPVQGETESRFRIPLSVAGRRCGREERGAARGWRAVGARDPAWLPTRGFRRAGRAALGPCSRRVEGEKLGTEVPCVFAGRRKRLSSSWQRVGPRASRSADADGVWRSVSIDVEREVGALRGGPPTTGVESGVPMVAGALLREG